jgi:hypothetical protein
MEKQLLSITSKLKTPLLIVFLLLTIVRIADTAFFIAPLYIMVCGSLTMVYFLRLFISAYELYGWIEESNDGESFSTLNKPHSVGDKIFDKIMSLSSALIVLFILFTLMFWPGAKVLGYDGIGTLVIAFIMGLISVNQTDHEKQKAIMTRELIFGSALILVSIYLLITPPKDLYTQIHKDPKRTELFFKMKKNPANDSIRMEYQNYILQKK